MKSLFLLLTPCLCFFPLAWTFADAPAPRPDSHAPLGVMGDRRRNRAYRRGGFRGRIRNAHAGRILLVSVVFSADIEIHQCVGVAL